MNHAHVLLHLAYLRAELAALEQLVTVSAHELPDVAVAPEVAEAEVEAPEAAEAEVAASVEVEVTPEPATDPVRWRYTPGAWYRLTGPNPFRSGNHDNLFAELERVYGQAPFSRVAVSEHVLALRSDGRIQSTQAEPAFVLAFLRRAGPGFGSLTMAEAPDDADAVEVAVATEAAVPDTGDVDDAPRFVAVFEPVPDHAVDDDGLPPEPDQIGWRLEGTPGFREGSINHVLWETLGDSVFSRESLSGLVDDMLATGALLSNRPPRDVARTFLNLVVDRGLASPA